MNSLLAHPRGFNVSVYALVLVLFFLPFLEVSCMGERVSVTGHELAFGSSGRSEGRRAERDAPTAPAIGEFKLVLACAVLAAVLAFASSRLAVQTSAVAGLAGLAMMFMGRSAIAEKAKEAGGIVLEYQPAFYGVCGLFLLGAFLAYRRTRGPSATGSPALVLPPIPNASPTGGTVVAAGTEWTPPPAPQGLPPIPAEVTPQGTAVAAPAGGTTQGSLPTVPPGNVPPPTPMSKGAKIAWGCAIVICALAFAGVKVYERITSRPADKLLAASVVSELGITAVEGSVLSRRSEVVHPDKRVTGQISMDVTLSEPVYEQVDTGTYLASQFKVDVARLRETRLALSGDAGEKVRQLAGVVDAPASPLDLVLVREVAPQGRKFTINASYSAVRNDGKWEVVLSGVSSELPAGKPLSTFGVSATKVGDGGAEPTLQETLARYDAFEQTVAAAREQYRDVLRREREAKIARILQPLQAGALFRGTVTNRRNQTAIPLWLTVTDFNAQTRQVQVLLRNDGGWQDARQFQGECGVDEQAGTYVLNLVTREDQCVKGAGPLLDAEESWTIQLGSDAASGDLKCTDRANIYHLTPLSAEAAETEIAQRKAALDVLLAACAPKSVYRGTVVNKQDNTAEPVLLEFVKAENSGALLQVQLSSEEHPVWRRALRGTLIASRYRSGGSPLRLKLSGDDRVRRAARGSVFSDEQDRQLQLSLGEKVISGEDRRYRFHLEQLSADELVQLAARREAREKSLMSIIKTGTSYYGTIRNGSFISNALLRFTKADLELGEVTFTIESRVQTGIYSTFEGAIDPSDGLVSAQIRQGRYNRTGVLKVPFFSKDSTFELSLTVDESGIAGHLVNNTDWVLSFPVRKIAADSGVVAYPTTQGAYVMAEGGWVPLPRNNGRAKTNLGAQFGDLLKDVNEPTKLADLVFDGRETPPAVSGANVMLLFVGPLEPAPQQVLEENPQLIGYPMIELAPLVMRSDGKRSADLVRIASGIAAFGDKRCAATCEEVGDNLMVLTCVGRLQPGNYGLSVNNRSLPAFELRITE